ncbi:RNA polymerase-binding transcription factor DksA [Actinoplanes lutulentus]|uniref:TraR/DksA family transcriptional regulator n=1 Tax=Actinoplanes lutulentus TaxID=1287878 RepID=A0A327ZJ17_9ACTN|nr:TraR/DksA C4-type zinc finger protein [Actinoplanes lutulentus]MBB2944566.1 RNA polymerase-binding transcription factor DksA [Actinoplanes lutulentus]RAK42205.1 TraR/DksA family transcriptional regulator [Actinoplanes lutulentus]
MVRDELLRLRARAQTEAATLAHDLESVFAASRDSNADDEHDPEGATIGFERAQLTALLAAARDRIAEVDAALARVDAGTYGVCERCAQPIAADRLAARPFARHCITCA